MKRINPLLALRAPLAIVLLSMFGCGKPTTSGPTHGLQPVAAAEPAKNEAPRTIENKATASNFRFAEDEAGKLLAKVLPPTAQAWLLTLPIKEQRERPLPSAIAQPDAPAASETPTVARYPQPPRGQPRPMPLPDRPPLDLARATLERPEIIVLPTGSLTKLDAPDVKQPTPPPILARPSIDRASFEDPTSDYTARSIINANLPLRAAQAPFVRINLPDPFENATVSKVKVEIKDEPTAIGSVPPMK